MFYSPSTKGFYDPKINGLDVPADFVTLTKEEYSDLFAALRQGKVIVPNGKNKPTTAKYVPSESKAAQTSILELESTITQRRLREAILGTDDGWLANVEKQISNLRKKL